MTIDQMQDVLMFEKDLLTADEAIELLADMFDESYEISPTKIRRALSLKEKSDE